MPPETLAQTNHNQRQAAFESPFEVTEDVLPGLLSEGQSPSTRLARRSGHRTQNDLQVSANLDSELCQRGMEYCRNKLTCVESRACSHSLDGWRCERESGQAILGTQGRVRELWRPHRRGPERGMARFAPQPAGTGPVFPMSASLLASVTSYSALVAS